MVPNVAPMALRQQVKANHEFVFVAKGKVSSVSVAGPFNSWNKDATQLKVQADGKTWKATVAMEPGRQPYKFVIDGTKWIPDPANTWVEDDGGGNNNSVALILPPSYIGPAVKGDGIITDGGIVTGLGSPYCSFDGQNLTLRIKTRVGDVENVSLSFGGQSLPCQLKASDDLHDTYEAVVPWDGQTTTSFSFVLKDGPKAEEISLGSVDASFKAIQVPSWTKDAVFYQIFPDRFLNGDKSNDPQGTVDWNSKPQYINFFGGDIAGIDQKIPYLKKLGVNGIYLTPLFTSPSNHGYEVTDYRSIDPRYGTNQDFKDLSQHLHQSGIKVILDGVFNHSATNFFAFTDVLKSGSQSKFKDWYFVKSYPVTVKANPPYEAWSGFASMPKLNVDNGEVADYLIGSAKYWIDYASIDGWRLDSADVIDPRFWQEFRPAIKSEGQDKWILGEIWVNANKWLQGDMFDSVMNYPFRSAVIGFVTRKDSRATDLQQQLFTNYESYAPQVSKNLLNLLSSHDTPRFITECGNNPKLAAMGAVLQFTWPGTPSVYYGEELGMQGQKDPDNRRGMRWDLATDSNPMLALYTQLIHLRKSHPSLTQGEPISLLADDSHQIFSFGRVLDKDKAIVIVNRSDARQTIDLSIPPDLQLTPSRVYVDALSGKTASVSKENGLALTLDPLSSTVLLATDERSHS